MTARRKHFVTPGRDASKAEEIAWLENLASDVQVGSYMNDLFTKEMVAWVSEQIRNDFTPDLLGALQHQWSELSKAVNQASKEEQCWKIETQGLRDQIEYLQAENAKKAEYIASLEDKLQESNRQFREAWNTACDATREASDAGNKLMEADVKIQHLKLRIYDLEHGE